MDGKLTSLFAGAQIAVTAGVHTLRTTYNVNGDLPCLPTVPMVFPAFNYQAGHRYVLSGDLHIDDTAWNDPAHPIIATYVLRHGQYMEKISAIAQDRADAQAAQLQQQRDMPRIRKVGAEVCMHATAGIAHGYVEGVTDQKIKIRVDRVGLLQASPQGDRTIWDFPEHWYLCGSN